MSIDHEVNQSVRVATSYSLLWNKFDRPTQLAAINLAKNDAALKLNFWDLSNDDRDVLYKQHGLMDDNGNYTALFDAYFVVHSCRRLGYLHVIE